MLIVGIDPLLKVGSQGITLSNRLTVGLQRAWGRSLSGRLRPILVCRVSHRLSDQAFPADLILRRLVGKVVKVASPHPNDRRHRPGGGFASGTAGCFDLAMRAFSDLSPVCLPQEAVQWIKGFRPGVIYTCLGNVRMTKLTLAISRAAGNVPVVPHFMDDWPSTLYADGRLGGLPRRIFQRHLRRLFGSVPLGFCIGSHMAAEYASRYGLEVRLHERRR